jgi:asparagine synthase (glutamine-hydrolysing)
MWMSFEVMVWHLDQPFASLSCYSQWSVMRAAADAGIKVLLDGQGGDEVFGGYGKFRYAYLLSLLRRGQVGRFASEAFATLRMGDRYILDVRNGYRYLPKRLRRGLSIDSFLTGNVRVQHTAESEPAARLWSHVRAGSGSGVIAPLQLYDIGLDTLPQLLRYEDRSSMAFSIEARVPFLDHELLEMGLGLPDDLKIRGGWSKFALRQAISGTIPEGVRLRKTKLGFAAPERRWLSGPLREPIMDVLAGSARSAPFVDVASVRERYAASAGKVLPNEAYLGLLRVVALETWMKVFKVAA